MARCVAAVFSCTLVTCAWGLCQVLTEFSPDVALQMNFDHGMAFSTQDAAGMIGTYFAAEINGTVAVEQAGVVKNAAVFSGAMENQEYLAIDESRIGAFSVDAPLTLMFWFQITSETNSQSYIVLKDYEFGVQYRSTSAPLRFYVGYKGTSLNSTRASWSELQWYHVAWIDEGVGGRWRFYVDGVLEASAPRGQTRDPRHSALTIGAWVNKEALSFGIPAEYFRGGVDEVAIVRRALTKEQVEHCAKLPPVLTNSAGNPVTQPVLSHTASTTRKIFVENTAPAALSSTEFPLLVVVLVVAAVLVCIVLAVVIVVVYLRARKEASVEEPRYQTEIGGTTISTLGSGQTLAPESDYGVVSLRPHGEEGSIGTMPDSVYGDGPPPLTYDVVPGVKPNEHEYMDLGTMEHTYTAPPVTGDELVRTSQMSTRQ